MLSRSQRGRRWLGLALAVGMLLATPFATLTPALAQSQTELAPGVTALVANTGGEGVVLRDAPQWDAATLGAYPEGAAVEITEGPLYDADGSPWLGVVVDGAFGYLPASSLATDITLAPVMAQPADAAPLVAAPQQVDEAPAAPVDLNVRSEPGGESAILAVIPAGAPLQLTGDWVDAWAGVVVDGQFGWVDGAWLGENAAAPPAAPAGDTPEGDVYLLQEASSETGVVELEQRGKKNRNKDRIKESGNGGVDDASADSPGNAPAEPAPVGEAPEGGIAWPVSGGEWSIMQGYNGSSHQNQDGMWQYYYSLDIVKDDGETAGQPVYSPVNGTVTWVDPSSGGVSIDIGGGHAVAMFHVDFDPAFEAGTAVSQGEPMGVISGPGGPGYAEQPHLHFTLWTSSDDGNWDRHAVPFTGPFAIEGLDLPDKGGRSQYAGTTFEP
ncbi:MAG: SH3 domain-containing protein [Thermomicrobiales bacterium]